MTVSGTISSVNAITFTTDGYTLGGTGTITLTGSGGNITTGAGSDTINATIAGSVGLTKLGAGKLTLTGSNNYAGQTVLSGGTLELGLECPVADPERRRGQHPERARRVRLYVSRQRPGEHDQHAAGR